MIKHIAQENIGHIGNRAPLISVIAPTARAPAVRSINVNLSVDVAISHPESRHDGDWVQIVVHAIEVSVHLRQ